MMPQQGMINTDAFTQMTQQKYLFPADQITHRDWFVEMQKPLNITVADIRRDFTKFIKDFPVDIIPHQSDEELRERTRKHRATIMAAIRRNPKNQNDRERSNNEDLSEYESEQRGLRAMLTHSHTYNMSNKRPNTNPKHF